MELVRQAIDQWPDVALGLQAACDAPKGVARLHHVHGTGDRYGLPSGRGRRARMGDATEPTEDHADGQQPDD
ncbi:MAG TPA: hypothetical protein VFA94_15325, partial [Acidimicrobiales bacterium]|nr:hypothetical protein [Acidimicrobiales bacterium]